MKILIADDEKAVCSIFQHHLKQYPSPYLEYKIVNDGLELLSSSASWEPDLIITDIKMPNMTGLEAIEEIRNQPGTSSMRIYVLSGYTDFELVRQALRLGVADYIPKPIKYLQVEALLRKEEGMRYLGLALDAAYKLEDEKLALSLSDAIQTLADSYTAKDREGFEKALKNWKALSEENDVAISGEFFSLKFKSDETDRTEQMKLLSSFVNENSFPKGEFNLIGQITQRVASSYNDSSFGLDQVASDMGYSTQYLSMLFKKETGKNFSTYLTDIRIGHAKKLLRTTDLKIKEVAAECGYNYTNYFIKVFNKAEGIAPAEWKKNIQD